MKATLLLTILLVLTSAHTCHTYRRWTEKEKKDFAEKCSQTDTCDGLGMIFTGFDFPEIEDVLVRQIHNKKVVDTFYIHPYKSSNDKLGIRYPGNTDRKLYMKYTFQFITEGEDTFQLTDMKMAVESRFTMFEENYGCIMDDYKIDGVRFEKLVVEFVKK